MRAFPYIVLLPAIGAAAAIPLWPERESVTRTAAQPELPLWEMQKTITRLNGADEFDPPEMALLESLPAEYVPLLTRELARDPLYETRSRLFFFLATKVAQYESTLPRDQLDAAVEALLARLAAYPGMRREDRVSVDLDRKLRHIAGIRDPRITAFAERARAALKPTAAPAPETGGPGK